MTAVLYSSRMSDVAATAITVEPASSVRGRLHVPGDKSISHRYAILAALADGTSRITGYAPGADCQTTLDCLRALGVDVARTPDDAGPSLVVVGGLGIGGLAPPAAPIDAGNSGTTLRLLAGVLAAHPFETTVTGDASLRCRPMGRIVEPLERMGARVETDGGRPPITIHGGALRGIDHAPPVASAQVKSAVLLAGLHASGTTRVEELAFTRDHTERALRSFGVDVDLDGRTVAVRGGQRLRALDLRVPGDLSSAAFWAAAAAALPGSDVEIAGVGLNTTRSAFLETLRRAGALVEVTTDATWNGEPVGTVRVRHGRRGLITITPDEVPSLIDELPVLAALAAHGGGCQVSGAAELRTKESDRIAIIAGGLRTLGADVEERADGFRVRAGVDLSGGTVDAAGDHRMAMAFAIAALGASGATTITGAEAVNVSYPGFFDAFDTIRA